MRFTAHTINNMKKLLSLFISVSAICVFSSFQAFADTPIERFDIENAQEFASSALSAELLWDADKQIELYAIFDGGDGTPENPYVVTTAAQLALISQSVNSGLRTNECFILGNDIDLGGTEWTPIGTYTEKTQYSTCFQGVFDGAGHTISNFKITASNQKYVGFFGFVYNGAVKNLTLSDFYINVTSSDYVYAGGIVGRCIALSGGKIDLTSCHVKNAEIYSESSIRSSYTGGVTGYFMASSGSKAYMSDISCVDSSVTAVTKYNLSSSSIYAYAGGITGYFASNDSGIQSMQKCFSNASVSALHDNQSTGNVRAFAGGLLGFLGAGTGSCAISISECTASGFVNADSYCPSYAGGLFAYISVSYSDSKNPLYIENCYSTGNSYAIAFTHTNSRNYSCVGGIAGQISDSSEKSVIKNCYALGNAIDKGSDVSYCGAFSGYSEGMSFENCFVFDCSFVGGTDIFTTDASVLKLSQCNDKSQYPGFDFESVWSFDTNSHFDFPVLKDIGTITNPVCEISFISDGKIISTETKSLGEGFTLPEKAPELPDDVQNYYEFSHWSFTPDGNPINQTAVYRSTNIFAVFTSTVKLYTVSFVSDGKLFTEQKKYPYGSIVDFPDSIPEKNADISFRYSFSHWSLSPDGSEVNQKDFTVSSDHTFYAVFEAFDFKTWDGITYENFKRGTGLQSSPYEIENGYQLAYLAKLVNSGSESYANAYYKLTADILLGGNEWTPIGTKQYPFKGNFDADGYSIDRLSITSSETEYAGLFGYVLDAEISSVYLKNAKIDISESQNSVYAGALAGYIQSESGIFEIYGSKVTGSINVTSNQDVFAGGIAGFIQVSDNGKLLLRDSYSTCPVSAVSEGANAYAGGLVSYLRSFGGVSKISQCYSTGKINSTAAESSFAAGIAAFSETSGTTLTGCFSIGDILAKADASLGDGYQSSFAGHIIAKNDDNTDVIECVYYRSANCKAIEGTNEVTINENGFAAVSSNFRNQSFLSTSLGFDFENTWEVLSGYSYPTLKSETAIKPVFSVNDVFKTSRAVSADIDIMSFNSEYYTVTLSVYSERGRLLGIKSFSINNSTPKSNTLTLAVTGLSEIEPASYITVTVTDRALLNPLFTPVTKKI